MIVGPSDSPIRRAVAHALPFQTIFEEYHARRPTDLHKAVCGALYEGKSIPESPEQTWADLLEATKRSELAYEKLAALKDAAQYLNPTDETDKEAGKQFDDLYQTVLAVEQECEATDKLLKKVLHALQGTALCLSGGGIRSASFSLGVLQGLARFSQRKPGAEQEKPLLQHLDYLSTVSGGGYIGSWLMGWATRAGFEVVIRRLAGPTATSGDPEAQPIRHLREYTSYLAPRFGFTVDSLTLLAIVLRNMVLNWSLMVPLVISLLCLPELLYVVSYAIPYANQDSDNMWVSLFIGLASTSIAVSSFFAARRMSRPQYAAAVTPAGTGGISSKAELLWYVLPLCLAAWLLSEAWASQQISFYLKSAAEGGFSKATLWLVPFATLPPMWIAIVRAWYFVPPKSGPSVVVSFLVGLLAAFLCTISAQFLAEALRHSDRGPFEISVQLWTVAGASSVVIAIVTWFVLPGRGEQEISQGGNRNNTVRSCSYRLRGLGAAVSAGLVTLVLVILATDFFQRLFAHAGTWAFHLTPRIDAMDMAVIAVVMVVWRYLPRRRVMHAGRTANPFAALGAGRVTHHRRLTWSFLAPVFAGFLAALFLALCAFYVLNAFLQTDFDHFKVSRQFVVLALPLIIAVLMFGASVLSGLLSSIESEEEREWWARAGGLLFVVLFVWISFSGAALFGKHLGTKALAAALTVVGLGTGWLGSAAGLSAATTSGLTRVHPEQLGKFRKWLAEHDAVAQFSSGVAIVCLTLALATLTTWLREKTMAELMTELQCCAGIGLEHKLFAFVGLDKNQIDIEDIRASALLGANIPLAPGDVIAGLKLDAIATSVVCLSAALLALFANLFINVNTFSLHGMYRMRLTRAFLGASNVARRADSFTNFDPRDNLHEAKVMHSEGAPLHIINTALNLVATRNLAWQQRKAEPFTFSPLHSGSWRLGYVPTASYGGSRGVSLGTAMAISGAAFNPNMGYNSSPLVTLLMTFFNARLGWWLPNPVWPKLRQVEDGAATVKFLRKNGPDFALGPLINEALGRTNDTFKWIELSDGGHFENLGLYEMVMRRCHAIVLVDADADGTYEFEDLGNAIRKIAIDFGIPVSFPDYPHGLPMKREIADSNSYYALGEIEYSRVDKGSRNGTLLYIKPVLRGSEPQDIRAYGASHPTFPHESTINQFFNEAQFESYRHLGSLVVDSLLRTAGTVDPTAGCGLAALFDLAVRSMAD
jgi:hypothetical protein